MPSAKETQRVAEDVRLLQMLRQPENKLNTLRLNQLLTVKELYGAKERISRIESEFRKLLDSSIVGGSRDEIEKRLKEIREDNERLHLLVSEVDPSVQNTKASLATIRGKISDEYFRQTAENARFNKDIRDLKKELELQHVRLDPIEKAIEDLRSTVPGPHEITKLSDRLAQLESIVKSMQEKLDNGFTLTSDGKEALAETVQDQTRVRQSFSAFTPKDLGYLEKLTEAGSAANTHKPHPQATADEGNMERLPSSIPLGPQPPPKALQLLERYNHFSSSYRLKRPKSESRFIRAYLKKIDHVSSWYIQKRLLEEHPNLVNVLEKVETSSSTDVKIFLNLEKLNWGQVKTIMRRLNCEELFSLLETQQAELKIPSPPRRFNLRSNRRRTHYKH
ncbi:translation initiation factor eIF4A [Hypoxylon texense]